MSESTTSSKNSINGEDEFSTPEVIIVDGVSKFRDGKRWKSRWAVVTKLSPVADCLQLQVYRDEKERARNGHTKASLSLQNFLAMETGFTLDKESHTLAIICQDLCVVLAFDNRERLIQWSVRIANNLGEGQHYLVQLASAPVKSKLTAGPVKLHVTDKKFCLTGGIPPRLLGAWEVPHLRRYGVVDGRIVFEGGSRCGKGEGVHVLVPDPPQLSLIMDALDMSSKGQLVRGSTRESRRFGSVIDSPRKSMTSRLSEMRTLMPAESTANISVNNTNVTISSTMSPTPRESRSAEALCSACGEVNEQLGSLWISSESSSRCDLDNCDNISVAICPDDGVGHVNQKAPLSPARNLQGQPLQIAKPLPSAMERCLSCMSKLGQQGQDILTPSWTMDLNVSSSSSVVMGTGMTASASSATTIILPPQGSIGSGSDRLSISSHGSSGGATEYYYDTPRSVLVAEMRRAARANTPPGMFQNNQMQPAGSNNCHFPGGQPGASGGCPSPYRVPRGSMPHGGSNTGMGGCSIQNHNGIVPTPSLQNTGCGGSCHCPQSHGRAVGGHGNNHIYYNGTAEQKSYVTKPPINLHPGPGPGPYENYDFPRCVPPQASLNQNGCYPYRGEGSVSGPSSMSTIDWAKKAPMDRSSVATTASTSISMGSDQLSEFYDTPRQVCPCCGPAVPGCPCCSQNPITGHQQHQSHNNQTQTTHPSSSAHSHHSHYHNPSCVMRRDPLENYDVPPHNNPHNITSTSHMNDMHNNPIPHAMQHSSTSISINGEGKMPLVAGSLAARPNPNAIYAQVDKSKKTPRPLPAQYHQQHFVNCDSHPIYENRNAQVQHQPTYINLETSSNITKGVVLSKGKPPAPEPQQTQPQAAQQQFSNNSRLTPGPAAYGHSNYVNLEFADSLQLYENAKEITTDSPMIPKETEVLVHHQPSCNEITEEEIATPVQNQPESDITIPSQAAVIIPENAYEIADQTPIEIPSVAPNVEESTDEAKDTKDDEKSSASASVSISVDGSLKEESSGIDRRGSQESDEAVSLPLRRSSSVPCKGGHANRGSASSSDSGVSGDGGLFFDDSSPSNDIGSLCHHESLPRKSQRTSPGASTGKNTSATSTPRPQESVDEVDNVEQDSQNLRDPLLANRHYETIAEVESKGGGTNPADSTLDPLNINGNSSISGNGSVILSNPVNPSVAAVRSAETVQTQRGRNLVSEANSTSSGNSDMSDYIETLSSCSRGSSDTVTSVLANAAGVTNVNLNISASPKKSTSMKPRSGKEYFKIDRSMFKSD